MDYYPELLQVGDEKVGYKLARIKAEPGVMVYDSLREQVRDLIKWPLINDLSDEHTRCKTRQIIQKTQIRLLH